MASIQRALSRAATLSRQPSDFDPNECPICFELGEDIQQLKHTTNHEATSTHKACLNCRVLLQKEMAPCPWCRDTVLYVAGGKVTTATTNVVTHIIGEEKIDLPEDIKQSPCCGILVQKISGTAEMMCGCDARPAGGTLFRALRSGGCGHEWNWDTLQPIKYGKPGNPAHPRQKMYGAWEGPLPQVPLCEHGVRADEYCAQCPPFWAMQGTGGGGGGGGVNTGCCLLM
jgi:hypothetical protein